MVINKKPKSRIHLLKVKIFKMMLELRYLTFHKNDQNILVFNPMDLQLAYSCLIVCLIN